MVSWSTDTIRGRERFSFWREAVCQAAFNVSIEPIEQSPERFSASISARDKGTYRFASSESLGAYELIRNRRHIDSAPADHYSIFLQLRGQTVIHKSDASVAVGENDIAVCDGRLPFSATISVHRQQAIAIIPHAMVEQRAPWLRDCMLRTLPSNAPYADLARRHLRTLVADGLSDDMAAGLLTENLCNLLALATAPGIAPDRLQPELQLEAVLAFCRQYLHDPALSPQLAAARFGISVRTLHLRFAKLRQSFGRWLLENRLDACSKALCDPRQGRSSISEIAYRWGFNDLSHFNKAFRARFGMTPSDMRAGSGRQN
ncbi:MAG TPA: helix-turn-helix domain-containing protein [Xanthobacteraceae bacterium]|nr:helix-turn-helix domain-containing protein [Xanthobacteraceae bacterium]